jgi:hypothetical protein
MSVALQHDPSWKSIYMKNKLFHSGMGDALWGMRSLIRHFLEINMMRKTVLAAAIAAAVAAPGLASAQATSPHTVAGNMGLFSDYRFRGISQTFEQPAIQGGIDYSHASGFYLGTWASNVNGLSFPDGSIEMDFYGGYKFPAA